MSVNEIGTPPQRRFLTAAHKAFVLLMHARGYSAYDIADMVNDDEYAMKYEFEKRSIHVNNLYKQIKQFDPEEVKAIRLRSLADLTDIRLASKRERIIELQKIALSKNPSVTVADRMAAIKAIKAEIGEDVDKLAKALEGSGTTVVNNVHVGAVDLSAAPDNERNAIRKNIGGLLQGADRF